MQDTDKKVPLDEAMEQVRTVGARLAMMHLAYARLLVEEHGPEKGRDLIIKAIMEYGKMVGLRNKSGRQDLPVYGFHDKYVYRGNAYVDTRDQPREDFDFSAYKAFGCVLAKTFLELGEPELGALYCYVDPAKSMAVDPSAKLVHTACEVCGDGYCAFASVPTTEEERELFKRNSTQWKKVDPILLAGEIEEPATAEARGGGIMNTSEFQALLKPVTDFVSKSAIDATLAEKLNRLFPPGGQVFDRIEKACHEAIAAGWMCSNGVAGRRWGRVIEPSEETGGLSVDVVDLADLVGSHHTHPTGEVCMVMPVTAGAKFDGTPRGWRVFEPGTGHFPTVTNGEALILYMLPEGKIDYTKK